MNLDFEDDELELYDMHSQNNLLYIIDNTLICSKILYDLDPISLKSLSETNKKMNYMIKYSSYLSIVYELNEKYPNHIFLQILRQANIEYDIKQRDTFLFRVFNNEYKSAGQEIMLSQIVLTELKNSSIDDIISVCQWQMNYLSEMLKDAQRENKHPLLSLIDHTSIPLASLCEGILIKKQYEKKYPNNSITFDPEATNYYNPTRAWLLIDGKNLKEYETQLI